MQQLTAHTSRRSYPLRYGIVMAQSIAITLTLLVLAIVLKVWNWRLAPATSLQAWALGFDLLVVFGAVMLSRWGDVLAATLLGLAFFIFAIYHTGNLGEPCGCFGSLAISTHWSIISCILIVGGIACGIAADSSSRHLSVCLAVVMWGAIVGGASAIITERHFASVQRANTQDICEFLGKRHPFRRVSRGQPDELPKDFEIVILNRTCEKCQHALELLCGHSWNHFSQHEWIAAYREPKGPWIFTTVVRGDGSEPDRFAMTPASLRIERERVVRCRPVDDEFFEVNQSSSDSAAVHSRFREVSNVPENELPWIESELIGTGKRFYLDHVD